jgi:hypothetical protein
MFIKITDVAQARRIYDWARRIYDWGNEPCTQHTKYFQQFKHSCAYCWDELLAEIEAAEKPVCKECGGSGYLYPGSNEQYDEVVTCGVCKGTGKQPEANTIIIPAYALEADVITKPEAKPQMMWCNQRKTCPENCSWKDPHEVNMTCGWNCSSYHYGKSNCVPVEEK